MILMLIAVGFAGIAIGVILMAIAQRHGRRFAARAGNPSIGFVAEKKPADSAVAAAQTFAKANRYRRRP